MALNLSKLSDEELLALQSGDLSNLSDEALLEISGGVQQPTEQATQPAPQGDTVESIVNFPTPTPPEVAGAQPTLTPAQQVRQTFEGVRTPELMAQAMSVPLSEEEQSALKRINDIQKRTNNPTIDEDTFKGLVRTGSINKTTNLIDRLKAVEREVPGAGALRLSLQTVGALDEIVRQNKFDIAGAVGGGSIGFSIAGPPGAIAGSLIGGFGGKRLDIAAGTRAPESPLRSLGVTALEEGGSVLAAPLIKPVVSRALKAGSDIAERLGMAQPRNKEFQNLMLKEGDFEISDEPGRDIIQAQRSLLGERLLTTFEETRGQLGAKATRPLITALESVQKTENRANAFTKRAQKINTRVKESMVGAKPISDKTIKENVINPLIARSEELGSTLDELSRSANKVAPKAELSAGNTVDLITDAMEQVRRELGNDIANRVRTRVNRVFLDGTGAPKQNVTAADLEALSNDMDTLFGSFTDNPNVGSNIAAVYGKTVEPIVAKMMDENLQKAMAEGNATVAEAITSIAERNSIATQKAILDKQLRIVNKEGIKGAFKDLKTFNDFRDTLTAANAGDLLDVATTKFKQEVTQDLFQSLKNQPQQVLTPKKVDAVFDKYGEDLIREAGGEGYVKMLKDARLLGSALETSQRFVSPLTGAKVDESLARQGFRTFLGSIFSRISLITSLQDRVARAAIFGDMPDEVVLKMLQGEEGQRLIEKSLDDPIGSPRAYNTYRQTIRELLKAGAEAESMDTMSFEEYKDLVRE